MRRRDEVFVYCKFCAFAVRKTNHSRATTLCNWKCLVQVQPMKRCEAKQKPSMYLFDKMLHSTDPYTLYANHRLWKVFVFLWLSFIVWLTLSPSNSFEIACLARLPLTLSGCVLLSVVPFDCNLWIWSHLVAIKVPKAISGEKQKTEQKSTLWWLDGKKLISRYSSPRSTARLPPLFLDVRASICWRKCLFRYGLLANSRHWLLCTSFHEF